MNISITFPDDLANQMRNRWEDLPRHALEALAAAAYRGGILTAAQVRRLAVLLGGQAEGLGPGEQHLGLSIGR